VPMWVSTPAAPLSVGVSSIWANRYGVSKCSIADGKTAFLIQSKARTTATPRGPVLTALLAAVFLDERMSPRKAVGLAFGVAGIAFVVESRITSGSVSLVGILFTISALLSLVSGTILFRRLAPNGGRWIGNAVQNLAGGLALVPFAFTLENLGEVTPSWRLMLALAYSPCVSRWSAISSGSAC
jgi:hypothetical protein